MVLKYMKLIKFILLNLYLFIFLTPLFGFEVTNSLTNRDHQNITQIIKYEDKQSFVDYLNDEKNLKKNFVIKYNKIDENQSAYIKINHKSENVSKLFFNFYSDVCQSYGIKKITNLTQGTTYDELALRTNFGKSKEFHKIFYRLKDNIILKIHDRSFQEGFNSLRLYVKDVDIIPYIDFINIINNKTNEVAGLLASFHSLPTKYINGVKYKIFHIDISNIAQFERVYAHHINFFIDKKFISQLDKIHYFEIFSGHCINAKNPNNYSGKSDGYAHFEMKTKETINNVECVNCNFASYQFKLNTALSTVKPTFISNNIKDFNDRIKELDPNYYEKMISDSSFFSFVKNLSSKVITLKGDYPNIIHFDNINILNSSNFSISKFTRDINFKLKNKDNIQIDDKQYIYHRYKLIELNYHINNYLCNFNKFSDENDFEILNDDYIKSNFYNLMAASSKISSNSITCEYNIPSVTKLFIQKQTVYFHPRYNVSSTSNENIKMKRIVSTSNNNFSLVKKIFYIIDAVCILLILILVFSKYNLLEIKKYFIFLSMLLFFILFLFGNQDKYFLTTHLIYYSALYLIVTSIVIIIILRFRKTN